MEEGDRPGGVPFGPGDSDTTMVSREQMSLQDFAVGLGSSNYTQEPGIGDETSTRKEASLLMSLLATCPKLEEYSDEDLGLTSATSSDSSERSLDSEASSSKKHQRGGFRFTCPSLSLERTQSSSPKGNKRSSRSLHSTNNTNIIINNAPLLPATLLGRPLKVEDADALRLSADAMARNVLESYQKAIEWRIHAWVRALSRTLVEKEKELLRSGADQSELKKLLLTREAILVATLRQVASQVSAIGSSTSFRVLLQRVEDDNNTKNDKPNAPQPQLPLSGDVSEVPLPTKRRRVGSDGSADSSIQEMDSYNYTVTHDLVLDCVINLDTPAGYSEISLHVPGTIEGTFLSSELGMEEMKSVVVDLDTDMLSAMIEKSCRVVVRSSVESAMMDAIAQASEPQVKEATSLDDSHHTSVSDEEEAPTTTLTPALSQPLTTEDEAPPAAALVTPRNMFSDVAPQRQVDSVLLTIPDDFDDANHSSSSSSSGNDNKPRRISPQPGSPAMGDSSNNGGFITTSFKLPPKKAPSTNKSLPLISPPPAEPKFHEVPSNGPSLPMLVEAACRAMLGSN